MRNRKVFVGLLGFLFLLGVMLSAPNIGLAGELSQKGPFEAAMLEGGDSTVGGGVPTLTLEGYVGQIARDEINGLSYARISSDPEGQNTIGFVSFPMDFNGGDIVLRTQYQILNTALQGKLRVYVFGVQHPRNNKSCHRP